MLVVLLLFCVSCFCQIGYEYLEVYDTSRQTWVYGRLHYPNSTILKGEKIPLVVLSPGWVQSSKWYDYIWENLVPQGYVVVVMATWDLNPSSFPIYKTYEQLFMLSHLQNESKSNSKSPIYGMLNSMAVAMGHSEGGQASYFAGSVKMTGHQYPGKFNTTIVLSGCWVGGQDDAIAAVQNQTIPIFFITGTSDCMCPPGEYDLLFYKESTSTCKYVANIVDAGHCDFGWDGLDNLPCKLVCDLLGCVFDWIIFPSTQQSIVNSYILPWVDWITKNKPGSHDKLNAVLKSDESLGIVQYMQQC